MRTPVAVENQPLRRQVSAGLDLRQPEAADRLGFDLEFEAGDEGSRLGDRRLDFGQLQRRLVACRSVHTSVTQIASTSTGSMAMT